MQIIQAALAFAITMLVLSLTVSSLVEIVHRILSMREAGLKYMLGQIFDQVLHKYLTPANVSKLADGWKIPDVAKADTETLLQAVRQGFVERMSANRAPMGVTPKATSTDPALTGAPPGRWSPRLWSGRDLTKLTPAQFMERLGSIDVGEIIKQANTAANAAGAAAGDAADAVLKDIVQKFEAFGNEAASYFEGRARLLSVCVAVVLAFAIRVDAIELFNTYLSDPNARNSVIEQTQAVTAQYKAAREAADAMQKISNANPAPPDDVKKQIDALQKEWQSTLDSTRNTVKQYADLGLPIGWTKQNATLNPGAKTCSKDGVTRLLAANETCKSDETPGEAGWYIVLRLIGSLLLGGLLVGLGGPFWYDAVTQLTGIGNVTKAVGGGGKTPAAAAPSGQAPEAAVAQAPAAKTPDRPQPETPVGAFNVSQAALAAPAAAKPGGGGPAAAST